MAKRMISSQVIESERFNEMSFPARFLYVILVLNADTYGFVNSVAMLLSRYKAKKSYFNELVDGGFVLYFEKERVAAITHWKLQNKLRNEGEEALQHPEICKKIFVREDGTYSTSPEGSAGDLFSYRQALVKYGRSAVNRLIKSHSFSCSDTLALQECLDSPMPENPRSYGRSGKKIQPSRSEKNRAEDNRCEMNEGEREGAPKELTCHRAGSQTVFDKEDFYHGKDSENKMDQDTYDEIGEDIEPDEDEEPLENLQMSTLGGIGKGVVMLSEVQIGALLDELTLDEFNCYVERLADFILKTGAKVKSHYSTILKWAREDRKTA